MSILQIFINKFIIKNLYMTAILYYIHYESLDRSRPLYW